MKRFVSLLLASSMALSLTACGGGSKDELTGDISIDESNLDYTYGEHFKSDEPVKYTMFFNDNPSYPIKDTWETEGVFAKIKELTNVELDITVIDNSNYNDRVSLLINSGESAYIIPKIYDDTPYVDGGAVVPVSDYTKFMPNYTNFVEEYEMQSDIDTIVRDDGKYYRLPGLKEVALQDYTLLFRDDIFKAAGYDISALEKDWTWDDLYDIMVGVKKYMVENGMCKESDYIWSDQWCGSQSGQGSGGNLLNMIACSYGIYSGWSLSPKNGLVFNEEKNQFELGSISEEYKEFVTLVNKFISGGILDPETFTQDDTVASNKFYRGETVVISTNRAQYTAQMAGLDEGVGKGNYSVYMAVYPKADTNYIIENSRLECGVMVSTKAREELGDEGFVKMMRFIDWLWYSEEGQRLTKWGVEGETYTVDAEGNKSLTPEWYCGGLAIPATDESKQKDMRIELGYACGNFMYGGNYEQLTDNYSEELRNYYDRVEEYREVRPLEPAFPIGEDDREQITLWATPLIDNINTWTLQYVTGQKDIEKTWDEYVASCEALNAQNLVDKYNELYKASK